MRFKTTLVLFAVFAGLLVLVLLFDSKGQKKKAAEEDSKTLIALVSADVRKASLVRRGETVTLEKDEAGAWRLTAPFETAADDTEAGNLVDAFASLRVERVVEKEAKDLAAYGIPQTEVSLWVKGQDSPVRLLVGMENPLDKTFFAKLEGDPRVVLLAASLNSTLEKKAFDLRQKDVFKFTASDVKSVRVRAKDLSWQATREDAGWFLKTPVAALAAKDKVDSLLDSLSGLKAKEFVAETKDAETLRKFGLEKAEYEVALSLPAAGQELVFSLHRAGESSYATTSRSTKVVAFEGTLLADLDRKVEEMREKKVADFYSWEADRVSVKKDGLEISAAKEKVGSEEKWILDPATKEEADRAKVEAFVRKVEGLEAVAFIDGPGSPARLGLSPGTEIRIGTKDGAGNVKETVLFVGKEDPSKKQVIMKNAKFGYLFRVDSGWLQDLPKDKKDWKIEPPKAEEGKTDHK